MCYCDEWCTQLSTCYSFQFSPKTRQTMPLYDYLTPKLDFKCKFNHRQSFLYKGRLTVRMIRKFRIGSSLRIESRIGSSIRNRISKLRRSLTFTCYTISTSQMPSLCWTHAADGIQSLTRMLLFNQRRTTRESVFSYACMIFLFLWPWPNDIDLDNLKMYQYQTSEIFRFPRVSETRPNSEWAWKNLLAKLKGKRF